MASRFFTPEDPDGTRFARTARSPEELLPLARELVGLTGQSVTVYFHRTGSEYDPPDRQIVFGLTQSRLGTCVYSAGVIEPNGEWVPNGGWFPPL